MEMKSKAVRLMVGCLLVLALVLTSCQAATEEEEEGPAAGEVEEVTPEEEVPQYGGTITVSRASDPRDFDEAYANSWGTWTLDLTNDNMVVQDWTKGPSGTGEADIMRDAYYPSLTEYLRGHLAESWEFPDPQTHIYHIRKGVHFHDKEPANGREMTAEDVAFSVKRIFEMPGSWCYGAPIKPVSYETPDRYTLILKFEAYESFMIMRTAGITYVVPPEVVVDDQGNETEALRDWENSVGTGPFMLTDYVIGDSLTFDRNPNYWERDPFIPENRLPYADQFKILIVPDASTQLAALRAGKIDQLLSVRWEQRESLLETNPELPSREVNGSGSSWYLPCNVEPYTDIRVRQALSMAIDRDLLIEDFYHGAAQKLAWMVLPENPEFTPWDKLPAKVKDILSYDPDGAKDMLAEAGYPNGFKMELGVTTANADLAALCESMWESIGLDVEMKVMEPAVFSSVLYAHEYTYPLYSTWMGQYIEGNLDYARTDYPNNHTLVSDPVYDEMCDRLVAMLDPEERLELGKEVNLYALEKSWLVPLPSGNLWVFWQPWLKQYSGEVSMGYCHYLKPFAYAWVDQDMQ